MNTLSKIAQYLHAGDVVLTDDEVAFGLQKIQDVIYTLEVIGGNSYTIRGLRQDWLNLDAVRSVRERRK